MDHIAAKGDHDRNTPFIKVFITILLVSLLVLSDKTGQKIAGICVEDIFRQISVDYEKLITEETVRVLLQYKKDGV